MQPIRLSNIKKILITRLDRIGDVILTTPIFPAIKQKYPKVHISVLVLQETASIVLGNPWIDEVLILDKKEVHKSWLSTFWFGLNLRKYQFDVVIHLHATNRVNIISWLANIPIRIGYRTLLGNHGKNDFLLTHTMPEHKWQGKKHEAEYNFDLLKLIDVKPPERLQFYFPLIARDLNRLKELVHDRLGERYVVFHPSASCISKRWPLERLAQVADHLALHFQILPVIIGEGEGTVHASEMQSFMKERAVNLSGKLSLGMLGWLLKDARLLISNDSGPVHLAGAVGTPVISIFGRNQPGLSPARWKPISEGTYIHKDVGCAICLAHKCEIHFKCLTEISVEDVLRVVHEYEPALA